MRFLKVFVTTTILIFPMKSYAIGTENPIAPTTFRSSLSSSSVPVATKKSTTRELSPREVNDFCGGDPQSIRSPGVHIDMQLMLLKIYRINDSFYRKNAYELYKEAVALTLRNQKNIEYSQLDSIVESTAKANYQGLLNCFEAMHDHSITRRHLSDNDIKILRGKLQQDILRSNPYMYQDVRSSEEKAKASRLEKVYLAVDPTVAPFLGTWSAIEESKMIYPSSVKGRVCIIDFALPSRDGSDSGMSLTTGVVIGDKIFAYDGSVVIREGDFLGSLFTRDGKSSVYKYNRRRSLVDPLELLRDSDMKSLFHGAWCSKKVL
jgi:hypothetical protein